MVTSAYKYMTIKKKLRNAGIVAALAGSIALGGCDIFKKGNVPTQLPPRNPIVNPIYPPYPDPSPVPIPDDPNSGENDAPETAILRSFGDGLSGDFYLTFCGADPDQGDYINYIDTIVNGDFLKYISPDKYNPYCETDSIPIQAGTNSSQAISSDNNGLEGIVATDSFVSPTEAQAREVIDQVLADKGYVEGIHYEKDRIMHLSEDVLVDYRFLCSDGLGTKGIFENVSHTENLNTELYQKQVLESESYNPLYLVYLPEEELIPRIDAYTGFIETNNNCS